MKTTKILLAAAAATFVGVSAQAATDVGAVYVYNLAPNVIEVASNGQSYTQMKPFGMASVGIRVNYTAGGVDLIKSWKVWPEFVNGYGIATPVPSLKSYAASKTYGALERPKEIGKNATVSFPGHLLANNAVNMCNMMASSLRDQGKSNKQIFEKDRELHFEVVAKYEFATNLGGDEIFEAQPVKKQTVTCKKWSGAQIPAGPQALANPLQIKKATMKLEEIALMNGTCAVELTTAISTNAAGATIKYRFKHSSGKQSPIFTTKTAANNIAVVSHQWDIPNKTGPETGWMQLIGVSHDFQSNKASYQMNCKSAPGGLAQKPGAPKVVVPLGGNGVLGN